MAIYLVTGGLGFIGSHLCDALVARGDKVRILDDLSTGRRENAPGEAEVIIGDVADKALVTQTCKDIDGVFHLAAVASVQKGNEEWVTTHGTNLTGTVCVLDSARSARSGAPAPVVYASSAAVYGDNQNVPLTENSATGPLSAYGADKLGSELHARVATVVHGVPTTGLRFFNVYGPRQDPKSPYSGVIAIFADRLFSNDPVDIFGDGTQARDFIYVGDVVRHLLAAMAHCQNTECRSDVYNVCTGRETTILHLAQTMANILNKQPEIRHGPVRTGDIHRSLGNPALAIRALGLEAQTDLRTGLADTLCWINQSQG